MTQKGIPALQETLLPWLGHRYQGKVRDSYTRGQERILIATDRLSAFDRVLTTIPGKGQVLTQLAKYWFDRTTTIIANHLIAVPDPCVMIAHEVAIVPVEVVVRGFLAGSAWRDYAAGRAISGVVLPRGLKEFERLPQPIVTPYTKEAVGQHDLPISESELLRRGLVSPEVWEQIRDTALRLFAMGSEDVSTRGLLFADTKYEFGILNGKVVLADEIHTLDSSRFWLRDSYESLLNRGEAPEMLDKEPIRRWLLERGFSGDGEVPPIGDDYRYALSSHYVDSFARITGETCALDRSEPRARIDKNLRRHYNLKVD